MLFLDTEEYMTVRDDLINNEAPPSSSTDDDSQDPLDIPQTKQNNGNKTYYLKHSTILLKNKGETEESYLWT